MSHYDGYTTSVELNAFRRSVGLRPIVKGARNCLCCGNEFKSEDVKKIRICHLCKKTDSYQTGYNDVTYGTGKKAIPLPTLD